jgi:hypothetical protein
MRAKLTRRRAIRLGGIASLLIAATLVLSGCWATVIDLGQGNRAITLTQDLTNRLIWNCTAEAGDGSARAFCVLDRIEGVCRTFPEEGITRDDCYLLSSYGNWDTLDTAIKRDISQGLRGCLSYWNYSAPCLTDCIPQGTIFWEWEPPRIAHCA